MRWSPEIVVKDALMYGSQGAWLWSTVLAAAWQAHASPNRGRANPDCSTGLSSPRAVSSE